MVDINLFDEEEEKGGKQEKDWDSTLGKSGGRKSESFKDELNLDDDLGGPSALGDEALLGEEEVVPELEEPETKGKDEDYGFGDVKKKKTPVYYYLILVGAVFVAAAYVYFVVLDKGSTGRKIGSIKTSNRPSLTYPSPSQKRLAALPDTGRTGVGRIVTGSTAAGAAFTLIDAAKAVFDDLSKQEQFGAVLLDGDRFAVEYVSTTAGVSQQMGKRIQQLLGASDFKVSPEERHRMDGRVTYWGVISGTIGKKSSLGLPPFSVKLTSSNQFVDQMKNLARQNNLTYVDVKKQMSLGISDSRQTGFRLRAEGSRVQAMVWLEQLKKIQPTCTIRTLFLVPMEYFDNKANSVKLVLDLSVSIG